MVVTEESIKKAIADKLGINERKVDWYDVLELMNDYERKIKD
ncbi:hypothetical protein ACW2QC_09230 [Virgibacillus sp. FSP13]